ncbi:hypothetical protein CHM34_04210 [Paludifilum halophilum]|uniref:Uncharacterized protein n=1 Tax=Paludifilum halophilum TaxID=1642702 RepID=A0A235B9L9_9BACL|nr:hypothetical protein CHM34_04210 [Paludifilum halophilum]
MVLLLSIFADRKQQGMAGPLFIARTFRIAAKGGTPAGKNSRCPAGRSSEGESITYFCCAILVFPFQKGTV